MNSSLRCRLRGRPWMIVGCLAGWLANPVGLAGQGTVAGVIRDAATGGAVSTAIVTVEDGRRRVATGSDGTFALDNLPVGTHTLLITAIGYRPAAVRGVTVTDGATVRIDAALERAVTRLDEIVVTPGYFGMMEGGIASHQTLTREDIETIPQLGEDIFRAVNRLPGIAADDISTKLHVRGGTDQELLILFDGLELYEPYHLKDLDAALGVIGVASVGGIDMVTGGFGVEYGDKLAGVFNMRSRTPPTQGTRTAVGLSITNASFMSQGSFGAGRGQWLVSARRGYLDVALALTGGDDNLSPKYYDLLGKVDYQVHADHLLSARVLHADDDLDFSDEGFTVNSGWQSSYGWLTWRWDIGSRVTARTMWSGGRVTRDRVGDGEDPDAFRGAQAIAVRDERQFRFAGIKQDWSVNLTDDWLVKVGVDAKFTEADYDYFNWVRSLERETTGFATVVDTTEVALFPTGREIGAYIAHRVRPFEAFTAEVGVRYDRQTHTDDSDMAPRVLATLDLTPQTTVRASWGRYHQSHGIHELEVADGETEFFRSELAEQVAVGIEQRFDNGVSVRVEGYRRTSSNPRPRYWNLEREIDAFLEIEPDRVRVAPERGEAKGIELLVARDVGRRVAWSLSYALAKAEDEIDGRWVPRILDQRHAFTANFAYRPNYKWSLSGAWQIHSGWPNTPQTFAADTVSVFNDDVGPIVVTGEFDALNSGRLPLYHRLDVRLTRTFAFKASTLSIYLDMFNAYNRTNLRGFSYDVHGQNNVVTVVRSTDNDLIPLLPSLGFRWEF